MSDTTIDVTFRGDPADVWPVEEEKVRLGEYVDDEVYAKLRAMSDERDKDPKYISFPDGAIYTRVAHNGDRKDWILWF